MKKSIMLAAVATLVLSGVAMAEEQKAPAAAPTTKEVATATKPAATTETTTATKPAASAEKATATETTTAATTKKPVVPVQPTEKAAQTETAPATK